MLVCREIVPRALPGVNLTAVAFDFFVAMDVILSARGVNLHGCCVVVGPCPRPRAVLLIADDREA